MNQMEKTVDSVSLQFDSNLKSNQKEHKNLVKNKTENLVRKKEKNVVRKKTKKIVRKKTKKKQFERKQKIQ